jgi:hypothetical protein
VESDKVKLSSLNVKNLKMTNDSKPSISPELKPLLDAAFSKSSNSVALEVFKTLSESAKENVKLTGMADFLVYKAYDGNYHDLTPLAIHLLQEGWAVASEQIATYAAVVGYQCELATTSIREVQDNLNESMSGFGFSEKVVLLKNEPLADLLELSKCVVRHATPEVRAAALKALLDAVPTAKTALFDEPDMRRARPRL